MENQITLIKECVAEIEKAIAKGESIYADKNAHRHSIAMVINEIQQYQIKLNSLFIGLQREGLYDNTIEKAGTLVFKLIKKINDLNDLLKE